MWELWMRGLRGCWCSLQDVSDLFGADLPVEGGRGGQFAWRDGPLLTALKAGHWVVLDEVKLIGKPDSAACCGSHS